ncbi:MAG: SDR family NAD(P)-dependent oxidoreductase [Rickettsiales bacterium]|nr:SDR family NAD(P)-dependent oxidoreductase [Rickettsiales bacterium]
MKTLEGKVALITGASQGIGAALAQAYAGDGAQVVMVARSVERMEQIDDLIRAEGGKPAVIVPCDLLEMDLIDAIGPNLLERFGKLDILVGNAAMLGNLGPLTHMEPKTWQKVMDLNVTANYRLLRICEPLLKLSETGGRVMMVTSSVGQKAAPYWGAYKVSKSALDAMVQMVAAEWNETKLRINAVNPGATCTAMRAKAMPGEDPEMIKKPEEVVHLFLELANDFDTRNGEIINA